MTRHNFQVTMAAAIRDSTFESGVASYADAMYAKLETSESLSWLIDLGLEERLREAVCRIISHLTDGCYIAKPFVVSCLYDTNESVMDAAGMCIENHEWLDCIPAVKLRISQLERGQKTVFLLSYFKGLVVDLETTMVQQSLKAESSSVVSMT